jgi:hypothetical protein
MVGDGDRQDDVDLLHADLGFAFRHHPGDRHAVDEPGLQGRVLINRLPTSAFGHTGHRGDEAE